MLYVEILLIRWISTEIRVFAYFKNLTLIACFFGMGLGCMLSRVRWLRFYLSFPILVVLVGAIVLPNGLSEALSFIIGVNSLGLIAIGFYLAAFVFANKRAQQGLLSTSS